MLKRAFLSLGSNVGDREKNLRAAISRLDSVGSVFAISGLYETEPVEFKKQPWFLNCVVGLETEMAPRELLDSLLALEKALGRQRTQMKGPRTIDLDILLYDDEVVQETGLVIPHPALTQRRFVLEPLAEIAPEFKHPVLGKSMGQLRDELPTGQAVRKVGAETPAEKKG